MPHPRGEPRQPPDPAILPAGCTRPMRNLGSGVFMASVPARPGFRSMSNFRVEVKRLQKDPSERVRTVALHVDQDACRIEALEANLDRAEDQGRRFADHDQVRKWKRRQATRYWLPL